MPRRRQNYQHPVLTFEQMQVTKTILYDCSVDLRIQVPRDQPSTRPVNLHRVYRITLITLAHEFVTKHPECKGLLKTIYKILKKTIGGKRSDFKIMEEDRERLALDKSCHAAGHLLKPRPLTAAISDTIEYSGGIDKSYQYATDLGLDCTVQLFLCPGNYAGKDVYTIHGFPVDDYYDWDKEEPQEIIDWCNESGLDQACDLGKKWEEVSKAFEQNLDYFEMKCGKNYRPRQNWDWD